MSFWFCNHLNGEEMTDCFTLTVYLVSCDEQYSVALTQAAVSRSAECDCGIF